MTIKGSAAFKSRSLPKFEPVASTNAATRGPSAHVEILVREDFLRYLQWLCHLSRGLVRVSLGGPVLTKVGGVQYLAGVHGSRTHLRRRNRLTTVLKTERPTGTLPPPNSELGYPTTSHDGQMWCNQ